MTVLAAVKRKLYVYAIEIYYYACAKGAVPWTSSARFESCAEWLVRNPIDAAHTKMTCGGEWCINGKLWGAPTKGLQKI